MPFGFHPLWIVILLAIVLIIFGPGKLPELGGAIGKGIREFRKASSDLAAEVTRPAEEPAPVSPAKAVSDPAATDPHKPETPAKS